MSINLVQWEGSTVTPKLDAIMYDDGSYGIIKGCAITHQGTNLLKIASGFIKIAGRLIEISEETISCEVSSSGTVNGQLWVRLDLSSVTPVTFMTEAASVLTPLTQNEDCNFQNGIYELQLATYNVNESVITNLVETGPELKPLRKSGSAENISFNNTGTGMSSTDVQNAIVELKNYVGDGKTLVANAITAKGQTVAATASFQTMANKIGNLKPSTYINPSGNKAITANGTGIDVKSYATASVNVLPTIASTLKEQVATNNTYNYTATFNGRVLINLTGHALSSNSTFSFTVKKAGTIQTPIRTSSKIGTYMQEALYAFEVSNGQTISIEGKVNNSSDARDGVFLGLYKLG